MNQTATASLYTRTKSFAQDNPIKSWYYVLSSSFFLIAALAATLPAFPIGLRIASSGLAGLLIVRMFVIYHDQQHRAILPKSKLAELYMRVFGIWVLCPSSVWRSTHDYHHANNSKLRGTHVGSYPIMTKEQYRASSRLKRFTYLFTRHPITMVFGYVFVFLFSMVVHPLMLGFREHYDCLISLLVHFVLATLMVIYFGWIAMVLTLILPMSIASALGAYLFYAQHNFPGVVFKDKDGWTHEKAALESSSHLVTGPVLAWFTGNIGYHHIHHLNHRIPFYRLPEAYRATAELQKAKTITLRPSDILRCLSLKVWCPETQQMVGIRGL